MKRLKKALACLLTFCLALGIVGFITPVRAMAASSFENGLGKITFSNLDGTFKDGKYRFNISVKYDKKYNTSDTRYNIRISNVRLEDSSGKTVKIWKDWEGLGKGGSTTVWFALDFSKLSSGKYTFKYFVNADSWDKGYGQGGSTAVNHSQGSITYSSCKYVYDTTGNKKLEAKFNVKGLKGYVPKVQIYNANGKLIRTFPKCGKISSDDKLLTCTWGLANDEGTTVSAGSYTMKVTINGKSCCKKFKIDPN